MALNVVKNIVENEKMRVFIVHGIAEHLGRYDLFTAFLNEHGYSVIRFDLRGHGKSEGKRGYVRRFEDYLADLDLVIMYNKGKRNCLLGHSMGALITHLYMLNNKVIDCAITSAGPTYFIKDAAFLRFTGYRYFGFLKVKNNLSFEKLSHIRKIEEDYMSDPLVLKSYYINLIGEMFIRGVRYLNKHVDQHQKPILMLHGSDDKIVPEAYSKRLFELLPQQDKTYKVYHGMWHEILNETDSESVMNDIVDWLEEHHE
jgi:alpha-beta hydrolase superfamily lysophospholipase